MSYHMFVFTSYSHSPACKVVKLHIFWETQKDNNLVDT